MEVLSAQSAALEGHVGAMLDLLLARIEDENIMGCVSQACPPAAPAARRRRQRWNSAIATVFKTTSVLDLSRLVWSRLVFRVIIALCRRRSPRWR